MTSPNKLSGPDQRDHLSGREAAIAALGFVAFALEAGPNVGGPELGEQVNHQPVDLTAPIPVTE